jgi:hypothetical protein
MTTTRVRSIERRLRYVLLAFAVMTPVASAQSYSRDITYVSRGKNPLENRGTFVLNGLHGRADYRLGAPAFVTAALHFYLENESVSSPGIRYLIYKEGGKTRLWAFQFNEARPGEFVIYVNESGEWQIPEKWAFYDLSHKYQEWPEAPVYESMVISAASPVYYSNAVTTHRCFGGLCHHWHHWHW